MRPGNLLAVSLGVERLYTNKDVIGLDAPSIWSSGCVCLSVSGLDIALAKEYSDDSRLFVRLNGREGGYTWYQVNLTPLT